MKNECTDAVLKELESHGLHGTIEHRGKHLAVVWEQGGAKQQCFVSLTPSDYRAPLKARADARRMLSAIEPTNNVVFLPQVRAAGGEALTNSRHVAEAFDKEHRNVLRDIDNILKSLECSNLSSPLFHLVMIEDGSGIERRTYDMTQAGFMLLAMGFTGTKAINFKLSFIAAFDAMEKAIATGGMSVALQIAERRIAQLEGNMDALTDLMLEAPAPAQTVRKGAFIRPSVMRKLRRMA